MYRLHVYVTEEDRQFFHAHAAAKQISVSGYIRLLANLDRVDITNRIEQIRRCTPRLVSLLCRWRQTVAEDANLSEQIKDMIALVQQIEEATKL